MLQAVPSREVNYSRTINNKGTDQIESECSSQLQVVNKHKNEYI